MIRLFRVLPLILLTFVTFSAKAQDSSEFAFDLYKKMSADEGNLFFSPFSISSALTMTAAGAKGKTFDQMEKVLHLAKDPHDFYLGLMPKLKSQDYELLIANRLWGKIAGEYSGDFLKRLKDNYSSDLVSLDFVQHPDSARIEINKWVEEKTQSKIKDLLNPGTITSQTDFVITNAIYFKGLWAEPFEPHMTKKMEFTDEAGIKNSIPFLNKTENYYLAKNKQAKMVSVPYKGFDLSMVIILPTGTTTLAQIEQSLSAKSFNSLYATGEIKKVRLAFPKFKTEYGIELNQTLKSLGMVDAFDAKAANFEGIRKPKSEFDKLFISKIIHKAFIETDEKGTEAAASTAVIAMVGSALPREEKPEEFIVDRSFIYLIRHQSSGAILFMGRYSKLPPVN